MGTDKTMVTMLAVLTGVLLVSAIAMGGMMGGGMGPGMMYGYGNQAFSGLGGWAAGLAMGLGMLMMLAFWGTIILGIALLVRWVVGHESGASTATDDSLAILQRRYASGDIDEPTYRRMRNELTTVVGEPTSLHRAS